MTTIELGELIKTKPPEALAAIKKSKRLLQWRSTPNRSNPLLVAAFSGHTPFVKAMLEMGVDVNFARADGFTALVFAA